jgi:mRNA interferase RelE/StbE
MDGYDLLIKPSAVKEIERIRHKGARQKVITRIEGLAADPRPEGSAKLSGREEYRVRQGSHRIVYAVDDEARTVLVVKVGHRRDVYR